MKRLKYILASLLMVGGMGAALLVPVTVHADSKSVVCESIGAGADCSNEGTGTDINNVVTLVVNILSWLVGVVAVIMIMVAGFRYITAGGDSNSVAGAKNTLIYAIVGLVIVALAQFIVQFVINKATSSNSREPAKENGALVAPVEVASVPYSLPASFKP